MLYKDGERRYILAPKGVKAGDEIRSGADAPIKPGNALPLRHIPVGSTVHNIELKVGKGGQLARSAGGSAQFAAREGVYASVRLKSGEMRKIHVDCRATIGEVGNDEHNLRVFGKAGAVRWLGVRPTVRGVVMNPVDHPHGGGEGKSGQGNPHPVSPWGLQTKGKKTRRNKRTDGMIVQRRKNKRFRRCSSASFAQERPVRRFAPGQEGADGEPEERSPADQDLVAPLDGHPRHGRPDHRRA